MGMEWWVQKLTWSRPQNEREERNWQGHRDTSPQRLKKQRDQVVQYGRSGVQKGLR